MNDWLTNDSQNTCKLILLPLIVFLVGNRFQVVIDHPGF